VGAASGDEGALFTLELRRRLALPIAGSWQARAFFDSDYIEVNTHQFAVGPNSATLNSLGLGLDWSAPDGWFARLDLAKSIGSTPTLLGSTSTPMRAWLEVSKSF
jgi:hemolysin activation/secretion protein